MCQQQEQRKETQSQTQRGREEVGAGVSVGNTSSSSNSSTPPSLGRTPSAGYVLFLHREELRRRSRKAPSARSSITKIHLTSELIARTKQNISKCSFEDLNILARETLFKRNLQRHLHHRRMQMQLWQMAKRQKQLQKIA
ncbi:uncharacterized protein [Drosophila tropicalis]|uniref:uncharacterized protein n=1 Tax=Drosophila tropicalis TaxID=46794 RepID=UPI0035AB87D2